MEGFTTAVSRRLSVIGCPVGLCVGLDPHDAELGSYGASDKAQSVWRFCEEMIDSTADVAACYKPNSAFFEALGSEGFAVLERVCKELRSRHLPILLDAKRGDISSTGVAYATAAFERLNCEAVTVCPYLGGDSIQSFTRHPSAKGRGVFVLCKTSNPGSNDLQTLNVVSPGAQGATGQDVEPSAEPQPLFLHVADMCGRLDKDIDKEAGGCVGLVVGATDIDALKAVRQRQPDLWILAPGIGAQGGDLEGALKYGRRTSDSSGLLLPVSRAISRSACKKTAAREMMDAIIAGCNAQ